MFRSGTKITQHSVLLMEMLFLGSMLMIIIVTNLAGNLFLKTCTPDYTATVYLPRDVGQNAFSQDKLVPKLSQDVCLGKGSGGIFTNLEAFLSILSHQLRSILLKLVRWVLSCPLLMSMSGAFSVLSL